MVFQMVVRTWNKRNELMQNKGWRMKSCFQNDLVALDCQFTKSAKLEYVYQSSLKFSGVEKVINFF